MAIGDDFEIREHPVTGILVRSDGVIIGRRGKPLRPTSITGYQLVTISTGGRLSYWLVHRMVAETFLGLRDGMQVNHKDGHKENNAVDNLEWCTASENNRHAIATGLRTMKSRIGHTDSVGEKNGRAKITPEVVRKIRSNVSRYGDKPWTKFGISNAQYYSIRNFHCWKGVV